MIETLNFYIDESGTRRPDKKPGRLPKHGHDWFGMGGVLIKSSDEIVAREIYKDFCAKWNIDYPLHSSEIRAKDDNFAWVGRLQKAEHDQFYEDLYQVMKKSPFVGLACVIDRPGYKERYEARYGKQSWILCKTAFNIAVERAAKYANELGLRLRVLPEECNKAEDNLIKGYYKALKEIGQPFNPTTSCKYAPLDAVNFNSTLFELKFKKKSSPMIQMADLYLWPMCIYGYDNTNYPYRRLREDGKLIECVVPKQDWDVRATKYSCFPK